MLSGSTRVRGNESRPTSGDAIAASKRIIANEENSAGTSTSTSALPPSRFLALPPELRLLIYRHLMPNRPVKGYPLKANFEVVQPLREDGEACHPAILRVCRLVYHESLPEWYSAVSFHVRIGEAGLSMLGVHSLPAGVGPPTPRHSGLAFIRQMCLYVCMPNIPLRLRLPALQEAAFDDASCCLEPFLGVISLVEQLTSSEYRLEQLDLRLEMPRITFQRLQDRPIMMRRVVESMLQPLRALSGLQRCSLRFKYPEFLEKMTTLHRKSPARHLFEQIVHDVWTPVLQEMTRPGPPGIPKQLKAPDAGGSSVPSASSSSSSSSSRSNRPHEPILSRDESTVETAWVIPTIEHRRQGTDTKENQMDGGNKKLPSGLSERINKRFPRW
ncbi:MAG: hypothetical protein M1823_004380 [Watsoniomyces obsoletus]|nr:MAG: hypothetical protein M1823_004380 [Watsoniomyces obsoletus]